MRGLGLGIGISPRASRAAFTPTALSGCVLWLRADLGITLNGSDVSAWADQSGQAHHVAQGTGSVQPLYNATDADFGGAPSVEFGSSDQLDSALWGASQAQPWTVYFVGKMKDSAATRDMADLTPATNTLIRQTTTNIGLYAGVGLVSAAGNANTASIIGAIGNGASSSAYLNSAAAHASGNAGTNAITRVRLGMNWAGGSPFEGKIAEVIACSGAHDQATRLQVMTYLAARYGITLS